MSDPAPSLPPLQQAALDPATVAALFRDLAACTRILSVSARTPGALRGQPPASLSLAEAETALLQGSVQSIQIRYAYDNATWCDTLIAGPAGMRIVRIKDADIAASMEKPVQS